MQNVVADGISRWPKTEIAQKLQTRVQRQWREQKIGGGGRAFFETIVQPKLPTEYIDDII